MGIRVVEEILKFLANFRVIVSDELLLLEKKCLSVLKVVQTVNSLLCLLHRPIFE